MITQKITPCLLFVKEAEHAAKYYVSIFKNSKMGTISRYGKEGQEFHHQEPGTAIIVSFQLEGQEFTALNGPPSKFSEAISFQVPCETQEEIDYYWGKLTAEGGEEGPCGWLKDKYGLSWQIFPAMMTQLLSDPVKGPKAMKAFMQMKKFDIQTILDAVK